MNSALLPSIAALESKLKDFGGQLITPAREVILVLPTMQLLQQLREGKLSAVEVLDAFQAKVETQMTPCGVVEMVTCV